MALFVTSGRFFGAVIAASLATACVPFKNTEPGQGASTQGGTSSQGSTGSEKGASSSDSTASSTSASPTGKGPTSGSGNSPDSSATKSETSSGNGNGNGTGEPTSCAHAPAHTCSQPIDCGKMGQCGGAERFDAMGCQRKTCSQGKGCGAGEVCYRPEDFGGCEGSGLSCSDGASGRCECMQTEDCGGSYCIPEAEYPPRHCAGYPAHTCYARADCGKTQSCGPLKPFTSAGCLRSSCTQDSDCSGDQVCYRALDWGGCESSSIVCTNESDTECACSQSKDCAGSYCVDKNAVPALCARKDTESDCLADNQPNSKYQCAWVDVRQVEIKSGSCEQTVTHKACVAMRDTGKDCQENKSCKDSPRTYVPKDRPYSDEVLYNSARCGLEPLAWTQCLEGVSTRACDCECKP